MKTMINDNILAIIAKTPEALMRGIADRVRERRFEKAWTQKMLAAKAGITLPSYRRFETTGEISLRSLVMIAVVLDMTDEFETLFNSRTYQSIDDILKAELPKQRKRGNKNG